MTAASLPNLGRDEKVTHPDSRLVTYQQTLMALTERGKQ